MSGVAEDRDSGDPAPIPLTRSESFVGDLPSHDEILARKKSVGNIIESPSKASAPISSGRNGSIGQLLGGNSGELGQTSASNSVAGSAAGGGRMRQIRGATQLLYSELLNRPGGPWAWYEKDNGKEKALPKTIMKKVMIDHLSVWDIGRMEMASPLWREMLKEFDSGHIWQRAVHAQHGALRIETFKIALGFRHGQSYEQETEDLLPQNWKRIMRMERASELMPEYKRDAHVTELRDHKGPVLAMSAAGPYLFTGGADKRLLLYRVPVLLHFTPDKAEGKVPPSPSRSFGPSGIAHDGPVLCLAARLDFVVSGSTDGVLKVWKVESAPGSLSHRTVKGHSGPLWCVCFAGERLIATGSADATACLWETDMAKTARPKVVLRGHSGGVTAIADVPGAGQVVTGSEDGTVRIWTFDGMCPSVLEGHACPILALRCWRSTVMQPESAQRKDGPRPLHDLIFAGDMDGLIRVWDRPSAAEVACADTHTDAVKGLAMSLTPDRSLASVSMDGVLCLWRPGDMVLEREVLPPESSPTSPKGGGEEQEEEDDHAESHLPALTSAVLWSNIVVTSGWDGVVRCYVWNEE